MMVRKGMMGRIS